MSIRLMTTAWEIDLPTGQKMVLLALADRANDDGECWPGQESLARKCSLSERAVRENLRRLNEAGLIEIEERYDTDTHARKTNVYHLVFGPENMKKPPADSAGGPPGSHRQFATEPPADSAGYSNEETSVKAYTRDTAREARTPEVVLEQGRLVVDPVLVARWSVIYPRVDVGYEIAKAAEWLLGNPTRRRKKLYAFIINWLSRADGDAVARGITRCKPQPPAVRETQCQSINPGTGARCDCQAVAWKGGRGLCQHHSMDESWGWEQLAMRAAA